MCKYESVLQELNKWEDYRSINDELVWAEVKSHYEGRAGLLDKAVIGLFNGDLGTIISRSNLEEFELLIRMLRQYHRHGENDEAFMTFSKILLQNQKR